MPKKRAAWLSPEMASLNVGVSRSSLMRWIGLGRVRARRNGYRWLVDVDSVRRVRNQTHRPSDVDEAATHAEAVRRVRAGAGVADLVVDLRIPLGVARDLFAEVVDAARIVLTERDARDLAALGYATITSGRALVQLVQQLRAEAVEARRAARPGR